MSSSHISLDHWRGSGETVSLLGHRIFFHDSGGNLPALLLLHGFPTSSWDWAPLYEDLSRRWRVITADHLGFGFSDKPRDIDYTFDLQADLACALLAHLGVRECTIFAHDYGDSVAQQLIARHHEDGALPFTVHGVCMLNGGIFFEAIRPRPIQKILHGPLGPLASALMNERLFTRSFSRIFAPDLIPSAADLHDHWRSIAHGGGHRIAHKIGSYLHERRASRTRWVRAMRQTTLPMRLICGLLDPVSGRSIAQRYMELIPEPDVVLLSDVGHYPQLEAPERVLALFEEFADTLPGLERG